MAETSYSEFPGATQAPFIKRTFKPQLVPVFSNQHQAESYAQGNLQAVLHAEWKERKARQRREAEANQAAIAPPKTLESPPRPAKPPAVPSPPPDPFVPLIGEAIATVRKAQASVPVELIQQVVAAFYGVTRVDILGRAHTRGHHTRPWAYTSDVMTPRHVAMYLAKVLTSRSLTDIGHRFGGRDHTTVLHGYKKIEAQRQHDVQLDAEIINLTMDIKKGCG